EPSREHHCDLGRSKVRGNANASIALGAESRMVTWRGERPARGHALPTLDNRCWIKSLISHEPPSHWCDSELTYLGLRWPAAIWRDVLASSSFSPHTMGAVNANAPEENRLGRQRGRPRHIHERGLTQHQLRGGFRELTRHAIIMQACVDCKAFSISRRG